ncbi:MAG: hypothetical protein AUI54_04970 [Acidobacteria bacterium 13_1_40CM_2_56_5]|nr:MAG: hypothetical protein AUI54_04970 [Acidobacteria bacterium 13_1_40CM_2_56_5]
MDENYTPFQIDRLFEEFFEQGLKYFFPFATFKPIGFDAEVNGDVIDGNAETSVVSLTALGSRYAFQNNVPFTEYGLRMLDSVSAVLTARYRMLRDVDRNGFDVERFGGLPEDRNVSAFLDPRHYSDKSPSRPDRIADAIEVLRTSALTTYENRRISTGALLFGRSLDPCHALPKSPPHPLHYSSALTRARSFHRLSDGLNTLALVDQNGFFVDVIDVQKWSEPYLTLPLPVPSPGRYEAHSRATLCGGHICLILTSTGEMKIFADGVQVFRFLDGRWRITDAAEKYRLWKESLSNSKLAETLFVTALNLAEDRRGGLLVVLDDASSVGRLVSNSDLLISTPKQQPAPGHASKDQFHYLLRDKCALNLPTTIIETIAHIDGALILDNAANLLAFGAILHYPDLADLHPDNIEGGRASAAIAASRFGRALKISEDGLISFYQNGEHIWDM